MESYDDDTKILKLYDIIPLVAEEENIIENTILNSSFSRNYAHAMYGEGEPYYYTVYLGDIGTFPFDTVYVKISYNIEISMMKWDPYLLGYPCYAYDANFGLSVNSNPLTKNDYYHYANFHTPNIPLTTVRYDNPPYNPLISSIYVSSASGTTEPLRITSPTWDNSHGVLDIRFIFMVDSGSHYDSSLTANISATVELVDCKGNQLPDTCLWLPTVAVNEVFGAYGCTYKLSTRQY